MKQYMIREHCKRKKVSRRVLTLIVALLIGVNGFSADYYWVGGAGNWSDLLHWATTSGGATFHPVVPGVGDDVHFDVNSFSGTNEQVSLNQTGICRNMDWTGATGNPIFRRVAGGGIDIHGSLTLVNGMSWELYSSNNNFKGTGMHTLTINDVYYQGNMNFVGSGTYSLQDSLSLRGSLTINTGSFKTNGNNISATAFLSQGTSTRSIELGSSIIYLNSIFGSGIRNTNLTFDAGTSIFRFYGNHGKFSASGSPGMRFHKLEFTSKTREGILASSGHYFQEVHFDHLADISGSNDTFHLMTIDSSIINLRGNNVFDSLWLTNKNGGNIYQFNGGSNSLIRQELIIEDGTCGIPNTLRTSASGNEATLTKTSGAVTIDHVKMYDIHATGGASFTANNVALDDGNNVGWTLNLLAAQNYYWVGGSGKWSDPTHWALTSGGPGQASSGCIPKHIDSVFFDANSFSATDTVTMDFNSECLTMDWTGAEMGTTSDPVWQTGPAAEKLEIYGSLTLNENMEWNMDKETFFLGGTGSHTITSKGQVFNEFVYINTKGDYTLQDSFNTELEFHFVSGTFNTNNQKLHCRQFKSTKDSVRVLTLGSSLIEMDGVFGSTQILGNNLTLNAGTSIFRILGFRQAFQAYGTSGLTYHDVEMKSSIQRSDFYGGDNTFRKLLTESYTRIFDDNTIQIACIDTSNEVHGSNTFDTLFFRNPRGNQTLFLKAGQTQTLNDTLWIVDGTCALPNTIQSLTSGSLSTFSKSSGTITVNFIKLFDIGATGGASFVGNNVIFENGNNPGWTLNSLASQNYYWVGNSGDWSDPTHWAFTSGGPGQPSTGCIPTRNDSVFFDVNSFSIAAQTVDMDIAAECKNMDWTGALNNPTFLGTGPSGAAGNTLSIFGSLTLIPDMTWTMNSYYIYFMGGAGNHTITSATKRLNSSRIFLESEGRYDLQDSISMAEFYFEKGDFYTNGHPMYLSRFRSSPATVKTRNLDISNSTITSYLNGGFFNITRGGVASFNATNSLIYFNSNGSVTLRDNTPLVLNRVISGGNLAANLGGETANYMECMGATFSMTGDNSRIKHLVVHKNSRFIDNGFIDTGFMIGEGIAYTHTFWSGSTNTFTDTLHIASNGCFPVNVLSSSSGSPATISAPATTSVDLDFLNLKDITATGGAVFNAGANSTDLGGNTGWVFTGPAYTTQIAYSEFCKHAGAFVLRPEPSIFARGYLWNDGSTGDTLVINPPIANLPDTFWIESDFGVNCKQRDTIIVYELVYAGATTEYLSNVVGDSSWFTCLNWGNGEISDTITNVEIVTGNKITLKPGQRARCNNLTIPAGATLTIEGGSLSIYGNLIVNGTFEHTGDSVILKGKDSTTISGNNVSFHKLIMDKHTGGSMTLLANDSISNEINLVYGKIYTSSSNLMVVKDEGTSSSGNINSFVHGPMKKQGDDAFVFPVGKDSVWARIGMGAPATTGSEFLAEYYNSGYVDQSVISPLLRVSTIEYWTLDRTAGTDSVKVSLYWEDNDRSKIVNTSDTDLVVAHYDGADWENAGNTATGGTLMAGSVTSNMWSTFSPFTFGALGVNPLPVDFLSFDAIKMNDALAQIKWSTASEYNADKYEVYRSTDGANFTKVGEVKARGTTQSISRYIFPDDIGDIPSGKIYYKLKQIDNNGEFMWTSVVHISKFALSSDISLQPNPANNEITLVLKGIAEGTYPVQIFDMTGKQVLKQHIDVREEEVQNTFNTQGLPNGVYTLMFNRQTLRLVINH